MSGTDKKDFQRARSRDQKQERREDILRAARAHLAAVGFERFSLVPLAKAAGVARGTLYLYFPTREELLLTIYMQEGRAWAAEVLAHMSPETTVSGFLAMYYDTALRHPLFLELAPHVPGVIEENVSRESLIACKRLGGEMVATIGERHSSVLGLPDELGITVFAALFSLLLGVTRAIRRPDVEVDELPDDVRQIIEATDPRATFMLFAGWLIRGAASSA